MIRLSKEDLKDLNAGTNSENFNWEVFKEKMKDGYFEESNIVGEPKLRRRKSKLERQHRCASDDSSKQSRKETFTLADLQEEMK